MTNATDVPIESIYIIEHADYDDTQYSKHCITAVTAACSSRW